MNAQCQSIIKYFTESAPGVLNRRVQCSALLKIHVASQIPEYNVV